MNSREYILYVLDVFKTAYYVLNNKQLKIIKLQLWLPRTNNDPSVIDQSTIYFTHRVPFTIDPAKIGEKLEKYFTHKFNIEDGIKDCTIFFYEPNNIEALRRVPSKRIILNSIFLEEIF